VTFAAIILCVASQRVFIFVVVDFVINLTQSGNVWIPPPLIYILTYEANRSITVSPPQGYLK